MARAAAAQLRIGTVAGGVLKPGDEVTIEIELIGSLTNPVVDWDVDLSGPGDQLEVSPNTIHVALAIDEDEAARMVEEGRVP